MAEFVKVGEVRQFREGRGRAVDLDGTRVAIFRMADGFVAFSDACLHMGASLAEGKLEGGRVTCAWHGWEYDVRTGQSDRKDWACLAVYEVKVEGQDVLLRRPDRPATGPASGTGAPGDDDFAPWDPEKFLKKK